MSAIVEAPSTINTDQVKTVTGNAKENWAVFVEEVMLFLYTRVCTNELLASKSSEATAWK